MRRKDRHQIFVLQSLRPSRFGAFQEEPADIILRFTVHAAGDARRFLFHPREGSTKRRMDRCWFRFTAGPQSSRAPVRLGQCVRDRKIADSAIILAMMPVGITRIHIA